MLSGQLTQLSWQGEGDERGVPGTRQRRLWSQRIGTVEPACGNLRHNKH